MRRSRRLRDLRPLLAIVFLLAAVYLLPTDTSLDQIRQAGVLRACVPTSLPPLVTGNQADPGIDVEILQHIADDIGVRLLLLTNSGIGRDFNPHNWRVTRAQCQIIAGGVIASTTTRSFLETTQPHLETGWALILPVPLDTLADSTVGFFAGVTGLDRIALSRFLRDQQARARIVNDVPILVDGLYQGEFAAGVSEALTARVIAGENDWQVQWLPEALGREPVALGLWKSDLTLKRSVERALQRLERRGGLQEIIERYEIAPIGEECGACRVETGQ